MHPTKDLVQFLCKNENQFNLQAKPSQKTQEGSAAIEKEALGVAYGLKKIYHFHYGRKFLIQTDQNHLKSYKIIVQSSLHLHWIIILCLSYHFEIKFFKGTTNRVVDMLALIYQNQSTPHTITSSKGSCSYKNQSQICPGLDTGNPQRSNSTRMATGNIRVSARIKAILDFQRRPACWIWHNIKRRMHYHSYHNEDRYAKIISTAVTMDLKMHPSCRKHKLMVWSEKDLQHLVENCQIYL